MTEPKHLFMSGYWNSQGWKKPSFTPDEVALLTEAGLLRPPETLDHQQAVAWAIEVRSRVEKSAVADAFLYSLSTRDLRYRSALGSFAHLMHMPAHVHNRTPVLVTDFCRVCGFADYQGRDIDFGPLNFERHKWGGVRHDQIVFAAYDLEEFLQLPPPPSPTDEDREALIAILKTAQVSKNYTAMRKAIRPFVPSNHQERGQICQILAYAGILQPEDCPAFDVGFVEWAMRSQGHVRSDARFPLSHWAGMSIRDAGVRFWFPNLVDTSD